LWLSIGLSYFSRVNDEEIRGRFRRDFTNEQISQDRKSLNRPQAEAVPAKPTEVVSDAVEPTKIEEPAIDDAGLPPINFTVEQKMRQPRPIKHRRKILPVIIVFLLLAAAGGGLAYHEYGQQKPPVIPQSVKTQAKIPILYPKTLPTGYQVVQSSFNVSAGNIVAYYAEDVAGDHLNFTIQARPANFDFEKFYSQSLSNTTRFTTSLGEGVVGTANGHLLGSLATTKSWVIVTGNNDKVTADKIQTALSNIQTQN
jgi:hypothetical protein